MRTIEIDEEIWKVLQHYAEPFVDAPNDVLRRLLGINKQVDLVVNSRPQRSYPEQTTNSREAKLKEFKDQTSFVDPAFLTFLIYKFHEKSPQGTSFIATIEEFMDEMRLNIGQIYWNPWMSSPYEDWDSCKNTISHFRECRRFGCWNGRSTKSNCDDYSCKYHPKNSEKIQNKCDLRNGVIWQKDSPDAEYKLGGEYLEVIKSQLLSGRKIPINSFIGVFYSEQQHNGVLIDRIRHDFNLTIKEVEAIFELN